MSSNQIGPYIAFDRGIDQVVHVRQGDTQGLPQRQEGAPSELGGRPRLETLLGRPTMDSVLEEAIRPRLEYRDLMVPSRFQAVLDSVCSKLSKSLEDEEKEGDPSLPPEKKRALQRAGRLLNSERELRGLLQMYRSVLYQG